ncbi:MAG TPA: hypothetical protein VGM90_24915 [Kofleriaceae bacterium]|jgi:hypothetical protein
MHDDDEPTIDTGFEHIGDTEVLPNEEPDTEIQMALPEEEKTNPALPLRLSQYAISFTKLRATTN